MHDRHAENGEPGKIRTGIKGNDSEIERTIKRARKREKNGEADYEAVVAKAKGKRRKGSAGNSGGGDRKTEIFYVIILQKLLNYYVDLI